MPLDKKEKILIICETATKANTIIKILEEAAYANIKAISGIENSVIIADDKGSVYNTGIYPEENFRVNLAVNPSKAKVLSEAKLGAIWADKIIVFTNNNPAGEFLGWNLCKFAEIPLDKCFCARAFELTKKAVLFAIENLDSFNTSLLNAETAKLCTDKFIGYGLSPIVKRYLNCRAVGRYQSIGLQLITERENEILNFIPEKYFNLYLTFMKDGKAFKAKYIGYKDKKIKKLDTKQEIKTIKYQCSEQKFTVEAIEKIKHCEAPPLPFCTATFLKEAINTLDLKAKEALNAVQKLYEKGFCTYFKTNATSISNEFMIELNDYIKINYKKISAKKIKAKPEMSQQECLRITDPQITPEDFNKNSSNQLVNKVYKLIWQRTIAAALPETTYTNTCYTISNNGHKFSLTEKFLNEPGFQGVYQVNTQKNAKISFAENEILIEPQLVDSIALTEPPYHFTEASMIEKLRELKISQDGSYLAMIGTNLDVARGYAILENKYIIPSKRGIQLAAYCNRTFSRILNLKYLRKLEEQLNKISSGELDYINYLKNFYENLVQTINNVQEIGLEIKDKKTCPICGAELIIKRNKFGKLFYGCDYPRCKYSESL